MFERFTDRARRVVVEAQQEARALGHDYIGTEHLLLGLISEGGGVGVKALEPLGVGAEALRAAVAEIVEPGEQSPSAHIPFTPRAKQVLRLSLAEALRFGHNYIGTEHLLLGILRNDGELAAKLLDGLGVSYDKTAAWVVTELAAIKAANSA